jgi:hypothetical protein
MRPAGQEVGLSGRSSGSIVCVERAISVARGNNQRLHSALGYRSPNHYETEHNRIIDMGNLVTEDSVLKHARVPRIQLSNIKKH